MDVLYLISIARFVGLILFLIGKIFKAMSWGNNLTNSGIWLMAIIILIEAGLGFYDGFLGRSHL